MASPNISEAVTATLRSYSKEIADNVTNNNALLTWLSKSDSVRTCDGGTTIDEQLDYQENPNAGSFSGFDIIPMQASEVFTAASFGWKEYAVAIMMSGREQAINSGESKIFDLWKGRIKNAQRTMANLLSEHLAGDGTGNGGKDITGLAAAIPTDPTTGTYGDINAATWAFWRSQLEDTAATIDASTITPAMNRLWAKCTRGTRMPKLILAGETFFTTYEAALQSLLRFTTERTAKFGFSTLKYKDADVVMDNDWMTATRAYFINTDSLKWRPHKDHNMVPMDERHPINQNAKGTFLYFMGNLTCSARKDHGLLIGD
jgi:hypothetical protein